MNEICQLDTDDVKQVSGVWCFIVTESNDQNAGSKRLKTLASERLIPIHKQLLELGFLNFINGKVERCERKLFSELKICPNGYYSTNFSKWFGRFLAKAGAAAPRTCFHSFRHSFRDAIRRSRISQDLGLALGGWTSGNQKSEVHDAYGNGFPILDLKQAIDSISYPNLTLEHLERIATQSV